MGRDLEPLTLPCLRESNRPPKLRHSFFGVLHSIFTNTLARLHDENRHLGSERDQLSLDTCSVICSSVALHFLPELLGVSWTRYSVTQGPWHRGSHLPATCVATNEKHIHEMAMR
jgi:hypothetical protein